VLILTTPAPSPTSNSSLLAPTPSPSQTPSLPVPESYLDLVPWQALAGDNHNFLLTERRRHYLRYSGGLTFFETNGPAGEARAREGAPAGCWKGNWPWHVNASLAHPTRCRRPSAVV
jgi:hypothetical protein